MAPEFETYLTDTVKDGAGDNTWKAARVALGTVLDGLAVAAIFLAPVLLQVLALGAGTLHP